MAATEDTPYDRETLPTREAWLEARRKGIGASDAPAIIGVSPWASPFTIYCDKRGVDTPATAAKQSERLKWGSLLQDPIAKELAERLKITIQLYPPTTIWRSKIAPFLQASLDGETVIDGQAGAVEIKTASVFERKTWTHEGEVPLTYQVQAQHQMAVTGYQFVLVGVLIGTEELRHARIDRDGEFIAMMVDKEDAFWQQVQAGEAPPPDGSEEAAKLLRTLAKPVDGRVIELASEMDLDLDERFRTAEIEAKRWKEELGLVKNLVHSRMGDAALAKLPGATWARVNKSRKAYTANVAATTWVEVKRS